MAINVYALCTIPVLLLVIWEFTYCMVKKNGYYTFQDSVSSMGTAIINQCVNLLVAALFFPTYKWIYQHIGFGQMSDAWWSYLILFVVIDFLFYWFHRLGHSLNVLWAAHMPHHSTEEMNYAVALRASVTQRAASFFFYWPAALLWKPEMVLPMVAFHLVLQFPPHTRVIRKLPRWFEALFNCPSHHRVHHGCNKHYRDRNFAGVFVIWDRLFGSFEPEGAEAYYGVTTPPRTWDPTFINFQWWGFLWKDAIATRSWWDKLRIWFMPVGWRPSDLPPRKAYVRPDATAATQVKFQSREFPKIRPYIVVQVFFGLGLMLWVTLDSSPLTSVERWAVSALLWMTATVWGAMLESKPWSIWLENIRILVTSFILLFLLNRYSYPTATLWGIGAFLALSFAWLQWLWNGAEVKEAQVSGASA